MGRKKSVLDVNQQNTKEQIQEQIRSAIQCLRDHKLPITKKAIAEEAGIAYSTIKKPFYTEFLNSFPEFSKEKTADNEQTLEELVSRINVLQEQLKVSKGANRKLRDEIERKNRELKETNEKYMFLLTAYNKINSSKILQF